MRSRPARSDAALHRTTVEVSHCAGTGSGIGRRLGTWFRYKPLPPDALGEIAAELSGRHSLGMNVHSSQDAGMGKTFSVRLRARRAGLSVVHVPVYAGLTPPQLLSRIHSAMVPHCAEAAMAPAKRVEGMKAFRARQREAVAAVLDEVSAGSDVGSATATWVGQQLPRHAAGAAAAASGSGSGFAMPRLCLHFDLGSTCDSSLDSTLFELCWMGGLQPSGGASGALLRWEPQCTAISIELANTHPPLQQVLPSCLSLQQVECVVSTDSFCADKASLQVRADDENTPLSKRFCSV